MKTRLLKNSKLAGGFGLLLALILMVSLALPVMAGTPHYNIFRGSVTVCDNWMPEGTVVAAELNGVPDNSVLVDDLGQYYLPVGYQPGEAGGETGDAVQIIVEGQVVYEGILGEGDLSSTGYANEDLELDPVLSIASSTGGEVTDPGEGDFDTYTCEEEVDLFADPDDDWHFVNWTGDVGTVDNVTAAETFIIVDGIYSITANFEEDTPTLECELTFDVIGTGSVTEPAASPETVTCGDPIDLLAEETNDCWVFDGWTADTTEGYDAIDNPGNPDTFITMDDDYSIHANFVQKTYDLAFDVIGTGSVTQPASSPVEDVLCGVTVDLLAEETNECWEFDGWSADTTEGYDAIDNPGNPDTFITMDDDYSIHANFVQKTYDLEVTVDGIGGVVTQPATSPVEDILCGNTVDLFADPDDTYDFDGWSADTSEGYNAIDDPDDFDTFVTVKGNYHIYANFIPEGVEYCELTFDVIGTGSITDPESSPESVPCGNTIDLLAEETNDCWVFDGWSAETTEGYDAIDNPGNPDTFITMDDDYSIHANFVKKEVYLTTHSTEGGYVSDPGDDDEFGPYDCGEEIDIVATATGCYNFDYWDGDTDFIDDVDDPTTTIIMNDDYEITAVFELAEGLEEVEIEFVEGWNTFSTPIYLHDCVKYWDGFEEVNELDIEMIYGYNSATQAWVPVYLNEEIKPLYGYYVKIKPGGGGTAYIIPNPDATVLPSRNLSAGVHLIGIAPESLEPTLLTTALFTLYEAENGHMGYELVVSPSANDPTWDYTRGEPDPPLMQIGRAYWLVMANADIYAGSTTTGAGG